MNTQIHKEKFKLETWERDEKRLDSSSNASYFLFDFNHYKVQRYEYNNDLYLCFQSRWKGSKSPMDGLKSEQK